MKRPGTRIRRIAARLCTPRTLERVIDPTIADLQAEYEEAARGARTWRRRWVWLAGHVTILRLLVAWGAARLIGIGLDATDEDLRPVLRTVVVSAVVMSVGTVLLVVPFVPYVPTSHPRAAQMMLYLIPQAVPLSLPVGLTFGVLWGLGRASASSRSRAVILSLAFAASVVSFSTLAWVMPAANQAFRVAVVGHPVPKGIRELSLGELRDGVGAGRDARLFALEYQKRWALGGAPVTLAVFAVVLGRGRRWGRLAPVATGFLTLLAYYVTMVSTETAGRHQTISVVTAAWAPNLLTWTSSLALLLYRPRPSRPAGHST